MNMARICPDCQHYGECVLGEFRADDQLCVPAGAGYWAGRLKLSSDHGPVLCKSTSRMTWPSASSVVEPLLSNLARCASLSPDEGFTVSGC